MWVQLNKLCVSCVWCYRRGTVVAGDGCDLASPLCKYNLKKGDLFVLSCAMGQRLRQGSISLELLMCGGGVCNMLLLHHVARCIETMDGCIWRMFVFMHVVVTVGMFVV